MKEYIVKLYDEKGEHVMTLYPCDLGAGGEVNYDLKKPDGTVVYCGINHHIAEAFPNKEYSAGQ
jgi:hypothetical protein